MIIGIRQDGFDQIIAVIEELNASGSKIRFRFSDLIETVVAHIVMDVAFNREASFRADRWDGFIGAVIGAIIYKVVSNEKN